MLLLGLVFTPFERTLTLPQNFKMLANFLWCDRERLAYYLPVTSKSLRLRFFNGCQLFFDFLNMLLILG